MILIVEPFRVEHLALGFESQPINSLQTTVLTIAREDDSVVQQLNSTQTRSSALSHK